MNYNKMLDQHKKTRAVCTVATITVPIEEAYRFGICNTRESGEIYEFEEKPKNPKSNLASMGIYIFKAEKLYKYLEEDEKLENTKNDFGGDVLPRMLAQGEKMMSYEFSGYWKDVGTISSLFEANMDLLGDAPEFDIDDRLWKIRSRNAIAPPHYIGNEARVVNSAVIAGCEIEGIVENSVLSHNVIIEKGANVKNSVIFSGTVIKQGAKLENCIIDENVVIGENAKIGEFTEDKKITVIGRDVIISPNKVIKAGEILDKGV
jgi:glucose-1-phosphate adenylyltransferase